jgi:hypothetical protein
VALTDRTAAGLGEDSLERHFNQQWAQALLNDAMEALAREYAARGQADKFETLRPVIGGGSCEDRVALQRARRRFRQLLRERVRRTVESAADVEAELRELFDSV